MGQLMEDYVEKRVKYARIKCAIKLWDSGMRDFQQIAYITSLPLDEVKKLFEGKSA